MRREVIGGTLDLGIGTFLDLHATTDSLSKKRLQSTSFATPITMSVGHETDFPIANQNTAIAKVSKEEPVAATRAYGDIIKGPPSQSDSLSEGSGAGPSWVNQNILMRIVQTSTLNDTGNWENCRKKCANGVQSHNWEKSYYRRIKNTTATVEHQTLKPKVARPLADIGKQALSRKIYLSSGLSTISSGHC